MLLSEAGAAGGGHRHVGECLSLSLNLTHVLSSLVVSIIRQTHSLRHVSRLTTHSRRVIVTCVCPVVGCRCTVAGGRVCVETHTQILKKKKKNTVCGACQSAISGIVCKDDGADPHPAANKYTPRIWTAGRGKRTRGNRNRTLVTHVRSVLRARTICARTPWGRAPSS